MIQIESEPMAYTGAAGEAIYQVSGCVADEMTEAEILSRGESEEEIVLGMKVLYGASNYRINVAPYVRGLFAMEPLYREISEECSGDGRVVWVRIRIGEVVSEWCPLLSGVCGVAAGTVLSRGPEVRSLAPGEWDECMWRKGAESCSARLRLSGSAVDEFVWEIEPGEEASEVVVWVVNRDDVEARVAEAGRSMTEFSQMRLEITDGEMDEPMTVRNYRLEGCRKEALRLAWVNEMGGVDYYSFVGSVQDEVRIEKVRVETPAGRQVVSSRGERSVTLVSHYETEETMRWLASLAGARKVWVVGTDGGWSQVADEVDSLGNGEAWFVPVDVEVDRVVLREEGALCRLEAVVTPVTEVVF